MGEHCLQASGTRTPFLVFLLTLALVGSVRAQSGEPFETSVISLHYGTDLSTTLLHDYWDQPASAGLSWEMPFYLGYLGFRADWLPLRSHREPAPDMTQILTTMAWGIPLHLSDRWTLAGFTEIGNNFMYRTRLGPLEAPESEFTAGMGARLQYRLTSRLGLRAGIRRIRVFTYHRMDLTQATFGLELHLNTPQRLVRFLQ